MTADRRPPADGETLEPLVAELPAGSRLYRVHHHRFAADAFNPGRGGGGRFHFVHDAAGDRVPALYAAETVDAAICETVFHDVPLSFATPTAGLRRVSFQRKVRGWLLSELETRRELGLAQLHDVGLDRLGLEARHLTHTDASRYPHTREWAQWLYAGGCDGLVWMARRFNSNKAMTFFGDRVSREDLVVRGAPRELWHGFGLRLVYEIAEAADVTVVSD